MQNPWVYVMLRNYDNIEALQCAFDWPVSWTYLGGTWDCIPNSGVASLPTGPGPINGNLAVTWGFNCTQGGSLVTVGRMIFGPPVGGGCLSIIESGLPFGTLVLECGTEVIAHVGTENRARACAGPGGYDACWPASTPVESATWGAIKSQYR
jgi:hypothetical protein